MSALLRLYGKAQNLLRLTTLIFFLGVGLEQSRRIADVRDAFDLNMDRGFVKGQNCIAESVEAGKVNRFNSSRLTAVALNAGGIQSGEIRL